MYDGMRATSKWAALYFILLMTIGNYILFNLLVAILVEGFANQPVSVFFCLFCLRNKSFNDQLAPETHKGLKTPYEFLLSLNGLQFQ